MTSCHLVVQVRVSISSVYRGDLRPRPLSRLTIFPAALLAGLSWLDRLLALFVLLAMIIGVVIGECLLSILPVTQDWG